MGKKRKSSSWSGLNIIEQTYSDVMLEALPVKMAGKLRKLTAWDVAAIKDRNVLMNGTAAERAFVMRMMDKLGVLKAVIQESARREFEQQAARDEAVMAALDERIRVIDKLYAEADFHAGGCRLCLGSRTDQRSR